MLFEINVSYYNFIEALTNRPTAHWGYKVAFFVGCGISAVGFVFAFYYDITIGRLIQWVKTGR